MKAQRVVPISEFQPSESLEKLKLMVEKTSPTLDEHAMRVGQVVDYKMVKGMAISWGLYNEDGVSVARTKFAPDSEFPEHSHDEKEFMSVYQGELNLFIDGKEHVLGVGDSIVICPGQTHYATNKVSTKIIVHTVPATVGFPEGP
jgi:quercetin dioxygenase-like cupin family protein